MPLFWCLHALWRSSRGSRRWIASGYPPTPGGGGRHRWAGKERTGGSGNIYKRGMPYHRHLQVEETHEEETSIPQVSWSWTIPRLDQIAIHAYQLHDNLIEVIDQSHIQSQKRAEIKTPAKTGFLGWSIGKRSTCRFLLRGSTHFFFLSQVV